MFRSLAAATAAALVVNVAVADEGMWTFDNVPSAAIQQKYGVTLEKPWLDRLQRSITRFESGCTGSFVSPDGLVLTNHHCAMQCLSELSSTSANYVEDGFTATARDSEKKCPTQILSVLVETEDVTAKVNGATAGLPDAQANQARKQELSKLEAA
jgi:S1-C subfamily serine protease